MLGLPLNTVNKIDLKSLMSISSLVLAFFGPLIIKRKVIYYEKFRNVTFSQNESHLSPRHWRRHPSIVLIRREFFYLSSRLLT